MTDEGDIYLRFKPLSEVISRLGFEGHPRPSQAVLKLLCAGDICARGDFAWKKYQNGNHLELNGKWEVVQTSRWQKLSELIDRNRDFLNAGKMGLDDVEFMCLKSGKASPYSWAYNQNHFSVAAISDDLVPFDEEYFEEEFSAWNIEVWPVDVAENQPKPAAVQVAQLIEPKPPSGGRSPANWWPDFAEELALYIFECGIPAGEGVKGQSAMLNAICDRMAANGKPEPGRSTVQPVINAVLLRTRAAGN